MPEASVNQNYSLDPGKNNVWRTGKVGSVQPKSKSEPMKGLTHSNFGGGIALPDSRHICTSGGGGQVVGHDATSCQVSPGTHSHASARIGCDASQSIKFSHSRRAKPLQKCGRRKRASMHPKKPLHKCIVFHECYIMGGGSFFL